MAAEQDTAQCKELSTKHERCSRVEGHRELHHSRTGIEWAIITKDTPELVPDTESCQCGAPTGVDFPRNSAFCTGCFLKPSNCICSGGPRDSVAYWATQGSSNQPRSDGQGVPVAERLIALIRERTRLGVEKYGELLTTHNGRDAMLDSLHESVDQNQYLMQVVLEQADEIAQLSGQIGRLADYLLSIGGPDRDESACETAVRLLKGFGDNADPSA